MMRADNASRWLTWIALVIVAGITLAQLWFVVEITVWHLLNASAVPLEGGQVLHVISPALVGTAVCGYLATVIAIVRRRALFYALPVPIVMLGVLWAAFLDGGGF